MKNFGTGRVGTLFCLLSSVFLLLPLVVVVGSAFTATDYVTFPPEGISLEPFRDIQRRTGFAESMWLSVGLAVGVAAFGTVLALITARGLRTVSRRGGRTALWDLMFLLPLMIPHVVLGVGLFQVFQAMGVAMSYWTLFAAHVVITMPYGVRILSAAEESLDRNAELAAANLGASPVEIYRRIVFPQLRPAIVATMFLAATVSLGEVGASIFLADAKTITLPARIFSYLEFQFAPFISAIGAVLIIVPLVVAAIAERPFGLARLFGLRVSRDR